MRKKIPFVASKVVFWVTVSIATKQKYDKNLSIFKSCHDYCDNEYGIVYGQEVKYTERFKDEDQRKKWGVCMNTCIQSTSLHKPFVPLRPLCPYHTEMKEEEEYPPPVSSCITLFPGSLSQSQRTRMTRTTPMTIAIYTILVPTIVTYNSLRFLVLRGGTRAMMNVSLDGRITGEMPGRSIEQNNVVRHGITLFLLNG